MTVPTFHADAYRAMSDYLRPASHLLADRLLASTDASRGETLIDIGCGDGNLALIAARLGWKAVGLDISASQIDAATARAAEEGIADRVVFRVEDEARTTLRPGSAGAVGSSFGVIFSDDPDAALARMMRLTRPGGLFGITTWERATASGVLRQVLTTIAGDHPGPLLPAPWRDTAHLSDTLRASDTSEIDVTEEELRTEASSFNEALHRSCSRAPVLRGLLQRALQRDSADHVEQACHHALVDAGLLRAHPDKVEVIDPYLLAVCRRKP